jgi:predicted O-methyltransferase YrrM
MVERYDNARFVEVGAWQGASTAYMAVEIINSGKNIQFDVYDIWGRYSIDGLNTKITEKYPDDFVQQLFLKNTANVRHVVNARKLDSVSASKLYKDESLDFVFIDADHTVEAVLNDIHHWFPKVKRGGHIAGHDYFNDPGVQKAVRTFFHKEDDSLYCGEQCWCVFKP